MIVSDTVAKKIATIKSEISGAGDKMETNLLPLFQNFENAKGKYLIQSWSLINFGSTDYFCRGNFICEISEKKKLSLWSGVVSLQTPSKNIAIIDAEDIVLAQRTPRNVVAFVLHKSYNVFMKYFSLSINEALSQMCVDSYEIFEIKTAIVSFPKIEAKRTGKEDEAHLLLGGKPKLKIKDKIYSESSAKFQETNMMLKVFYGKSMSDEYEERVVEVKRKGLVAFKKEHDPVGLSKCIIITSSVASMGNFG